MRNRIVLLGSLFLFYSVAWGQSQSMPGMDMSGHDMSRMESAKDDSEAGAHVMKSMEGHMDMGPHMKMTALRPMKPGDASRAQQVAAEARRHQRNISTIAWR